jgi:hypothetical protein
MRKKKMKLLRVNTIFMNEWRSEILKSKSEERDKLRSYC